MQKTCVCRTIEVTISLNVTLADQFRNEQRSIDLSIYTALFIVIRALTLILTCPYTTVSPRRM